MSEYWISKKKYYCQYCEIYIADDVPSRSQHENGLRHKGNKDRFIRGLYKAGIKKKQESEEETREMKRVEQAAQAAYARDVGAGLAKPGASSSSAASIPAPKPKPPPPKASNPYENYSTAASLGFTDPDVEHLVAEAKAKKSEGRIGDWVAVVPPPPPFPQHGEPSAAADVKSEPEPSVGEVRKREECSADDDDTRHFKMRKRTASVGLGEIYDPGIIQIKPRVDRKVKDEPEAVSLVSQGSILGGDVLRGNANPEADTAPRATEKPTWTRREWKWAGEDQANQETPQLGDVTQSPDHSPTVDATLDKADITFKLEDNTVKEEQTTLQDVQISTDDLTGKSLFRKRKLPGGVSTRGRRKM